MLAASQDQPLLRLREIHDRVIRQLCSFEAEQVVAARAEILTLNLQSHALDERLFQSCRRIWARRGAPSDSFLKMIGEVAHDPHAMILNFMNYEGAYAGGLAPSALIKTLWKRAPLSEAEVATLLKTENSAHLDNILIMLPREAAVMRPHAERLIELLGDGECALRAKQALDKLPEYESRLTAVYAAQLATDRPRCCIHAALSWFKERPELARAYEAKILDALPYSFVSDWTSAELLKTFTPKESISDYAAKICQFLGNSYANVRACAVEFARNDGKLCDAPEFPAILKKVTALVFRDPDPEVKRQGLWMLGENDDNVHRYVKLLLPLCSSAEDFSYQARQVLAETSIWDVRVFEKIREASCSANLDDRHNVAAVLAFGTKEDPFKNEKLRIALDLLPGCEDRSLNFLLSTISSSANSDSHISEADKKNLHAAFCRVNDQYLMKQAMKIDAALNLRSPVTKNHFMFWARWKETYTPDPNAKDPKALEPYHFDSDHGDWLFYAVQVFPDLASDVSRMVKKASKIEFDHFIPSLSMLGANVRETLQSICVEGNELAGWTFDNFTRGFFPQRFRADFLANDELKGVLYTCSDILKRSPGDLVSLFFKAFPERYEETPSLKQVFEQIWERVKAQPDPHEYFWNIDTFARAKDSARGVFAPYFELPELLQPHRVSLTNVLCGQFNTALTDEARQPAVEKLKILVSEFPLTEDATKARAVLASIGHEPLPASPQEIEKIRSDMESGALDGITGGLQSSLRLPITQRRELRRSIERWLGCPTPEIANLAFRVYTTLTLSPELLRKTTLRFATVPEPWRYQQPLFAAKVLYEAKDEFRSGESAIIRPLMNHPHPSVRKTAAAAINTRADWSRNYFPELHKLCRDEDRAVRSVARAVLINRHSTDARIFQRLAVAARDSDATAWEILANNGDYRSFMLEKGTLAMHGIFNADPAIRKLAVKTLALALTNEWVVLTLNPYDHARIGTAFGNLDGLDRSDVAAIDATLRFKNPTVRRMMIERLASIEESALSAEEVDWYETYATSDKELQHLIRALLPKLRSPDAFEAIGAALLCLSDLDLRPWLKTITLDALRETDTFRVLLMRDEPRELRGALRSGDPIQHYLALTGTSTLAAYSTEKFCATMERVTGKSQGTPSPQRALNDLAGYLGDTKQDLLALPPLDLLTLNFGPRCAGFAPVLTRIIGTAPLGSNFKKACDTIKRLGTKAAEAGEIIRGRAATAEEFGDLVAAHGAYRKVSGTYLEASPKQLKSIEAAFSSDSMGEWNEAAGLVRELPRGQRREFREALYRLAARTDSLTADVALRALEPNDAGKRRFRSALCAAVHREDPQVGVAAEHAIRSLRRHGTRDVSGELIVYLAKHARYEMLHGMSDDLPREVEPAFEGAAFSRTSSVDVKERLTGWLLLSQLSMPGAETVERARETFADTTECDAVRLESAGVLSKHPSTSRDPELIEFALARLESPSYMMRERAAEVISNMAPSLLAIPDEVMAALKDPVSTVRRCAAKAIYDSPAFTKPIELIRWRLKVESSGIVRYYLRRTLENQSQ